MITRKVSTIEFCGNLWSRKGAVDEYLNYFSVIISHNK